MPLLPISYYVILHFMVGVTGMLVWSLEQSATVVTKFKHPMSQKVNATWNAKVRRQTSVVVPTDYLSTVWNSARSLLDAVSVYTTPFVQMSKTI